MERKANHAYVLWPLLTFALYRSSLEGVRLRGETTQPLQPLVI